MAETLTRSSRSRNTPTRHIPHAPDILLSSEKLSVLTLKLFTIVIVIVIVIYLVFHKIHTGIEAVINKTNSCIAFVQ
jgi:hypothetical protein